MQSKACKSLQRLCSSASLQLLYNYPTTMGLDTLDDILLLLRCIIETFDRGLRSKTWGCRPSRINAMLVICLMAMDRGVIYVEAYATLSRREMPL